MCSAAPDTSFGCRPSGPEQAVQGQQTEITSKRIAGILFIESTVLIEKAEQFIGNELMSFFIGVIHLGHIVWELISVLHEVFKYFIAICQSGTVTVCQIFDLFRMLLQFIVRIKYLHPLIRRWGKKDYFDLLPLSGTG